LTLGNKIQEIYKILVKNFNTQGWWPSKTQDETIFGAILTQNVAWENVKKALKNLELENILTLKDVFIIQEEKLANLILPARFSKQKSRYLKEMAQFFKNYSFDFGTIKKSFTPQELRKTLLELKGVGPETADTILLYAFYLPFFVIDAYTKRIAFRVGLTKIENTPYLKLQELFTQNLPLEVLLFNEYHALLVKLAKENCQKRKPLCDSCPLTHLCLKQGLP